jgi:hypothetical protein
MILVELSDHLANFEVRMHMMTRRATTEPPTVIAGSIIREKIQSPCALRMLQVSRKQEVHEGLHRYTLRHFSPRMAGKHL